MLRVALTGLRANKLRVALTGVAIVVGVAFVTASFVFTDTIEARFERLFSEAARGVDVVVRPVRPEFTTGDPTEIGAFDASVLEIVRAVSGVAKAEGGVSGFAQLVDHDGNPIGGQGPPTLGFAWIDDPDLNPMEIRPGNGRAPLAADEIVVDSATASRHGLALGDEVTVITPQGLGRYRIVGIADFGEEESLAGATVTGFRLDEARRRFGLEGRFSEISVVAEPGVPPADLVAALEAILPDGVEAVTAEQATAEQLAEIADALGFLNVALLAFAGVAVFVGAFLIANTFRIIVAQRTRELALYRTIGATAAQVTRLVLVEAVAVAVVAAAVGIVGGVLLSEGLTTAMDALGFAIPDGPLTLRARTVVVGFAVGTIVTAAAALLPARRAGRIPPVAALRLDAVRPPRRSLRDRAQGGGALAAVGVALLGIGLFAGPPNPLAFVGLGAATLFVGIAVLGPFAVGPLTRALGWPLVRWFGAAGLLARENTRREPRRTAATASALMVGVALVVFVAILAASTKATVRASVLETFGADFTITSANFSAGIPRIVVEELAALPELDVVSAVVFDVAGVGDDTARLVAVDPKTIDGLVDLGTSGEVLARLATTPDGVAVAEPLAEREGVGIGDTITLAFPQLPDFPGRVVGIVESSDLGELVVTRATYDRGYLNRFDSMVLARAAGDLAEARRAVEAVVDPYANLRVQTKDEVVADAERQIDQLLALVTGLLFLAVVVAILGITNTLALSIIERTREIGLLRAVGMLRGQVRRMIRWEAVLIALFGALSGIATGILLGWAVVAALRDQGLRSFAVPTGQLAVLVAVAVIAGIVSAVYPGRRAARLDVLEAIAYE